MAMPDKKHQKTLSGCGWFGLMIDVFAKNEAVQVNVLLLTVFKLHCLEKQLL